MTADWPLHIRGPLDNQGGIDAHALALEGPYLQKNSGTITIPDGGRLRIAQGGTFDPGTGALLGPGVLEVDTSMVVGGHLVLPVDTRLQDATLACLSLTNPSTHALETAGACLIPVPFENRGRLRVTGFTYAQDTLVTSDSSVVTLEPGAELATLRGFTNCGTVQTTAACCTTQPAFLTVLGGVLSNAATGVLSAQNGWLHLSGMLDNQGLVVVGNDLPLAPAQFLALAGSGPAWINRGTIEVHLGDTLMVVGRSLVNQAGATLKGNGAVRMLGGTLENAGRIDPGLGGSGDPDLALRVLGSVRLMPTSVVHADLWPAYRHDVLAVSDTLWLGGTFEVALRDGFLPSLGDSLPLIVASRCLDGLLLGPCADPFPSAYADTFATVAFPALPAGMLWDLHYRPQVVGLLVADSTTGVLLALLQCEARPEGVELRWRFGDPDRIADVRVERGAEPHGTVERHDRRAPPRRRDRGGAGPLRRRRPALVLPHRRGAARRRAARLRAARGGHRRGHRRAGRGSPRRRRIRARRARASSSALPQAAQVRLSLVDVLGREVAVLVRARTRRAATRRSGPVSWPGTVRRRASTSRGCASTAASCRRRVVVVR